MQYTPSNAISGEFNEQFYTTTKVKKKWQVIKVESNKQNVMQYIIFFKKRLTTNSFLILQVHFSKPSKDLSEIRFLT